MADEYGSEAYRGAVDVTVLDPAGKQIHTANGVQDEEIEVDAHGVKVRIPAAQSCHVEWIRTLSKRFLHDAFSS